MRCNGLERTSSQVHVPTVWPPILIVCPLAIVAACKISSPSRLKRLTRGAMLSPYQLFSFLSSSENRLTGKVIGGHAESCPSPIRGRLHRRYVWPKRGAPRWLVSTRRFRGVPCVQARHRPIRKVRPHSAAPSTMTMTKATNSGKSPWARQTALQWRCHFRVDRFAGRLEASISCGAAG